MAAADALLARAWTTRNDDSPRTLQEQLARLEQSAQQSAQLLHDMAEQVNALTLAQAKTARRARLALSLSIVAALLGAAALILALI